MKVPRSWRRSVGQDLWYDADENDDRLSVGRTFVLPQRIFANCILWKITSTFSIQTTTLSPLLPTRHVRFEVITATTTPSRAKQVRPARSGAYSALRVFAMPLADFAHQEDESFEQFLCFAPNVGADSLRGPHRRLSSSPRRSRLTIPDSCLQNCASHPTCGRKDVWVCSGCPAPISAVSHGA